jgi:integrase
VAQRWPSVDGLEPFLRNDFSEEVMAWHECINGNYVLCFRIGDKRFRRSLDTTSRAVADEDVQQVELNLRKLQRGYLTIPKGADVISFLLSNGQVTQPFSVPDQITLKALFDKYFAAMPKGSLEETTIATMKVHRKWLESYFGKSARVESIDLIALQGYIESRSKDSGQNELLSPVTIRKEIMTLRTVFNWAKHSNLVHGEFPTRGLKYPKGKEKPPYMPFKDVRRQTKSMEAEEAAELWECAFLTRDELDELLAYVERVANHPYIYPMFVFCGHTGARRSEMARAKVSDLDFQEGFVTLHERKKSRETKTTRRVPMSGLFKRVMREWAKDRSGALFTVAAEPLTAKSMYHCFEYTLRDSKWKDLRGWHVFRHSFISCLASTGVDQRIIDEVVGHCTEQQRRRYRHLLPNKIKRSIVSVFG